MAGALLPLCALVLPLARATAAVPDCHEVRASFQLLHPRGRWAPESPVSGADLQVCPSKGLTCCSRKMEERYQVAARQNLESSLQVASAQLKLLIIQNAAVFQEAFEMVLRHGRNATLRMLREEFPDLRGGADGVVGQLFLDASLFILGSDSRVDDMVSSFFGRLFLLAYRRLLAPGSSGAAEECLRGAWRDAGAFGAHPSRVAARLSRSLRTTRVFLQALNLGIEVVNTTDHLRPGRDCGRALARLWYCPLCQGASAARPCPAACLAAAQGCLGGAAEVQPHWRGYVEGLAALTGAMRGEHDMEAVVMWLETPIRLALRHALSGRSRIDTAVSSACSRTAQRVSRSVSAALDHAPRAAETHGVPLLPFDPEETLSGRRRDFISSLKTFVGFFGGLGEALCDREPVALNDSFCWNGQEVTERFPSSGSRRAQPHNPESKIKVLEPTMSQIIDKLKHINQLLHLVTAPERRWQAQSGRGAAERGREVRWGEEGLESGDCDDEDECGGASGLGPPPRHRRLRIFGDLTDNLAMDGFTFHGHVLIPSDAEGGVSVTGAAGGPVCSGTPFPGAAILLTTVMFLFGSH
ncbi:glypican-3-like [Scleropages formosus]|uniref:Glypican-3 n=1 Tax=Scleropages formosus TaxID=113540 RepID=A0A8C9TYR1_SCLFO|nr:glypican-3-like [Scleropages formosus]